MQVEKNPTDPGENLKTKQKEQKTKQDRGCGGFEREKVHLEAGDTLLTLPAESTTAFLLFVLLGLLPVSQESVYNITFA